MRPTEFNCLPDTKAGFPVSATTLRKHLRQALLYMDCQGVVDDYPEAHLAPGPMELCMGALVVGTLSGPGCGIEEGMLHLDGWHLDFSMTYGACNCRTSSRLSVSRYAGMGSVIFFHLGRVSIYSDLSNKVARVAVIYSLAPLYSAGGPISRADEASHMPSGWNARHRTCSGWAETCAYSFPPGTDMLTVTHARKRLGTLGRVHGVGQGTGEPAEIFKSVASPQCRITQYMNPVTREAHLERVARLYCRDVVQQSLQQQPRQLEATDMVPASPAAEYALCRLALQKLQREDTLDASSDAVRLGLLFPGADSVPVRQRPALIRAIKTQAADLEKARYDPAACGPESELMSAVLGSLAKGELRKLFVEVEDAVADMHALDHVVWRLSGRRHQQQLAIKEKRRARQRFAQL
ncbi:hypothetical protein VOLCADRAFT_93087 [Volvox carteri f. nagariensis]|uniref:Uncharacterized protein n=1 Tax=Volvox carteri f. nagariensis TaxID=3068 RepID=D8U1B2_VOLCA|nr:uncharacterized protein VOLCADRAFT_93087 [Volvox carteri f. nagariensis]EFJ46605.1 hypothetical protein VOLCADRAFT_93087 [Volvox carteri f. nagariensis]|eukprot:XP_002952462.1 hypothetical protein VOLCADRAFT_93087 [Volvox carteri f. nagariensis]